MNNVENLDKYEEREIKFFNDMHSEDKLIDETNIRKWCKIDNYKILSDFLYFYVLLFESRYQKSKKKEIDKSDFSSGLVFTKIDILRLKDYQEENSIIEKEFVKNIDFYLDKLKQEINQFQFMNLNLEEKIEKAFNLKNNNNEYEKFMKEWEEDSEKYRKKTQLENIYKIMSLYKKWLVEYGYTK